MSQARQKGTAGENFFLAGLRRVFGSHVERAPLKGVHDDGDYIGVPWQHEAKSTKKPLFQAWARKAHAKSTPWVILWKGDQRRNDPGEGPLAVMPYRLYLELLAEISWLSDDQAIDPAVSLDNVRMRTEEPV